MKKIVTHDGVFHADEVFAIALLKVSSIQDDFEIIRTRDANIVSEADIVIDVGGKVSDIVAEADLAAIMGISSKLYFDHHQFDKDDKLFGLSSAGLVYKFLTARVSDDPITYGYGYETGWTNLYLTESCKDLERLVKMVDEHDTGICPNFKHEFIDTINGLNSPSDIGGKVQDKNFEIAIKYAVAYVKNLLTGYITEDSPWKELYKCEEDII